MKQIFDTMTPSPSGKQGLVVMDAGQFAKMPPCLTPVEAALQLKHCPKWVRETLRDRQIPVFKIGRKILIPESHLSLFVSV